MKEKSAQLRITLPCVTLLGVLVLFGTLVTSACVYKLDIQQGNVVDREKVKQLQLGMSKRQVRYLMGTPLVVDSFNQDRWDYYFSLKHYSPEHREGQFLQERLSLFFEKEKLSKIDNQLTPNAPEKPAEKDLDKLAEPPQEEHSQDNQ